MILIIIIIIIIIIMGRKSTLCCARVMSRHCVGNDSRCSPHVFDVVLVVCCDYVTIVSNNACQSIIPSSPVADRPATSVVSRRRHDDNRPIERHEQLARGCRQQTDERVHRLPFCLLPVDAIEVLDTIAAKCRVYAFGVNNLDAVHRHIKCHKSTCQ